MNDTTQLTEVDQRASPEGLADDGGFSSKDGQLRAFLAEVRDARTVALLFLRLALDDNPDVLRRGLLEDTVTWSVRSLRGRPVMGTLLGVLCDVVDDIVPLLPLTDPQVCSLAWDLALHPEVTLEHVTALMSYARLPVSDPSTGIGSTEAWIVSAATLAATWIAASVEGDYAGTALMGERVRSCSPARHLAHLHTTAAHAGVNGLGLLAAWPE